MASLIEEFNGAPPEAAGPETAHPESSDQGVSQDAAGTDESSGEPGSDDASTGDEGAEAEIDAELLSDVAKDAGLDLADPSQRAIAEKFARREMSKLAGAAPDAADELTEFEKSMAAEAAKPVVAKQPDQQQQQQQRPQQQQEDQRYFDVGDGWKNWMKDGYQAEADAWVGVQDAIDKKQDPSQAMEKVHAVRVAQFRRIFDADIVPYLNHLLPQLINTHGGKLLDSKLGHVMPQLEQSFSENRFNAAKESAIADLSKTKGFENVKSFYDVDKAAPTLQFRDPSTGQIGTFPNTLLNRTIKAFPEILSIRVEHKDPAVAERLTITACLKAVSRYARAGKVDGKAAKMIMDAGAQQQARRATERGRQALNAGGGAPLNNGAPADSFIGNLNTHGGGGMTLAQVLAGAGKK